MRVSIVIPAHNEAGNLGPLLEETYSSISSNQLAEVIVVDDASDDKTPAEVKALVHTQRFRNLRYLRHATQSGQSAALRSGIVASTSPIVATMDGDGQNDPRDIPRLLDVLAPPGTSGPALVSGVRLARRASGSKRWASRAANWIRDKVLEDNCPDTGCGIKAYWRELFLRLPFFTTMHRYLPALVQMYGHQVAFVPVNDRPRQVGISKYGNLNRAMVGVHDLIGVSWLRQRTAIPRVVEMHPAESVSRPTGEDANLPHSGCPPL